MEVSLLPVRSGEHSPQLLREKAARPGLPWAGCNKQSEGILRSSELILFAAAECSSYSCENTTADERRLRPPTRTCSFIQAASCCLMPIEIVQVLVHFWLFPRRCLLPSLAANRGVAFAACLPTGPLHMWELGVATLSAILDGQPCVHLHTPVGAAVRRPGGVAPPRPRRGGVVAVSAAWQHLHDRATTQVRSHTLLWVRHSQSTASRLLTTLPAASLAWFTKCLAHSLHWK